MNMINMYDLFRQDGARILIEVRNAAVYLIATQDATADEGRLLVRQFETEDDAYDFAREMADILHTDVC